MKKIFSKVKCFRINNGEWFFCNSLENPSLCYIEESEAEKFNSTVYNFEQCKKLIVERELPNCSVHKTLRGKEVLVFPDFVYFNGSKYYDKSKLVTIEIGDVYELYPATLQELIDKIPAETLCEFLRDRGITKI